MKVALRQMGNSKGVIIPKALIAQFGFEGEVDMEVTPEGVLLSRPSKPARAGWAEASKKVAEAGDDGLAWPEMGNEGDKDLKW